MQQPKVICLTSDKGMPYIPAFLYQARKYAPGMEIDIVGYTKPPKDLGARFISLGNFHDYPVDKWSNGLIKYLVQWAPKRVVILLEDYWLVRNMNLRALAVADKVMSQNHDIARFDLTADRLHNGNFVAAGSSGEFDLIAQDGPQEYSLSFQAAMWDREKLLDVLEMNETPWQSELVGTVRLNHRIANDGWLVYGTRQWPMRYIIAVNKGELDLTGGWMYPQTPMPQSDIHDLKEKGLLE